VSQPYHRHSFCKPRLAALPPLVGRCSQSGPSEPSWRQTPTFHIPIFWVKSGAASQGLRNWEIAELSRRTVLQGGLCSQSGPSAVVDECLPVVKMARTALCQTPPPSQIYLMVITARKGLPKLVRYTESLTFRLLRGWRCCPNNILRQVARLPS
jgi:hypothetical protein